MHKVCDGERARQNPRVNTVDHRPFVVVHEQVYAFCAQTIKSLWDFVRIEDTDQRPIVGLADSRFLPCF